MDLNVQRNISEKIIKAAKSGDKETIIGEYEECTKIYLQSVKQAINGCTNVTIPCALAALKIVEKSIIKLSASPNDMLIAEFLSEDCNFTCSAISFAYSEEKAGTDEIKNEN